MHACSRVMFADRGQRPSSRLKDGGREMFWMLHCRQRARFLKYYARPLVSGRSARSQLMISQANGQNREVETA